MGMQFIGARDVEEGVESGEGTGTLGRMLIVSLNCHDPVTPQNPIPL